MTPAGARRAEIARRYDRPQRGERKSLAALRIADLRRLFTDRYGHELPDDDAGRDDARIMACHIARCPDPERRLRVWLGLWAPWMTAEEAEVRITSALAKPLRWGADKLAFLLRLTEAERRRLHITTIGAIDVTKIERAKRRKERDRLRRQRHRRAQGAKPRAEYEANSINRAKPWEALGMSRASWYRAGKPTRETSPSAP